MIELVQILGPLVSTIVGLITKAIAAKQEDHAAIAAEASSALLDATIALDSLSATLAANDKAADHKLAEKFPK